MVIHSAVTKLLRKEFNIKSDEVLIKVYKELPESFYWTVYLQDKAIIVKKIRSLILSINMDSNVISETTLAIREGSLSGFRSAHNIMIHHNRKNKNTLKTEVTILISNINQLEWNKLEFKKKGKNIFPYTEKDLPNAIVTPELDEKEQIEILKEINQEHKSKQVVLNELLKLSEIDGEKVVTVDEAYKRQNQAIARIKYLRGFKCQICGTSIQKRDGQLYVEAAHIDPKRTKGKETLENIILLCPNHHKEFDLGNLEILKRNKKVIEFKLNGKLYQINLEF